MCVRIVVEFIYGTLFARLRSKWQLFALDKFRKRCTMMNNVLEKSLIQFFCVWRKQNIRISACFAVFMPVRLNECAHFAYNETLFYLFKSWWFPLIYQLFQLFEQKFAPDFLCDGKKFKLELNFEVSNRFQGFNNKVQSNQTNARPSTLNNF